MPPSINRCVESCKKTVSGAGHKDSSVVYVSVFELNMFIKRFDN